MTNSFSTKLVCAIVALTATTASFAEVTHAETLQFAYQQTDLTSAAGVAKINRQVDKFARNACRSSNPLHTAGSRKECREEVAAQLRDKIFQAGKREPIK